METKGADYGDGNSWLNSVGLDQTDATGANPKGRSTSLDKTECAVAKNEIQWNVHELSPYNNSHLTINASFIPRPKGMGDIAISLASVRFISAL